MSVDINLNEKLIERLADAVRDSLKKEGINDMGALCFFEGNGGMFSIATDFKNLKNKELAQYVYYCLTQIYGDEFFALMTDYHIKKSVVENSHDEQNSKKVLH